MSMTHTLWYENHAETLIFAFFDAFIIEMEIEKPKMKKTTPLFEKRKNHLFRQSSADVVRTGSLVMAKISSTICKISLKDKGITVWDMQDTRHPKCGSAISISIILAFQCHHPIPPCYTIVFTIMEGEICHREVEIVNDLYFKELHVRNRAQNQRQNALEFLSFSCTSSNGNLKWDGKHYKQSARSMK